MAKYNETVTKIRQSNNKPVPSNPYGRDSPANREYQDDRNAAIKKMKLERVQFAYGRFLEKKRFNYRTFMDETGFTEHIAKDVLDELIKLGLVRANIENSSTFAKQFEIISDKVIPDGWPAKGELMTMEITFKVVQQPTVRKVADKPDESRIINNPLTKALKNTEYHPMNGVDGYEQFMKDTAKFYNTPELDEIVKAVHELCKSRIEQQYIECPLCKGRIQRTASMARCTKCGVIQDGGTFEQSMKMLNIIAKSGVKVV